MTGDRGQPASPTSFSGLYLILDQQWASRCSLLDVLHQAGEAGVKLVQYRDKTRPMNQMYATALELRRVAAEWGMSFVVNDRCDLALAVDADGVHLGQTDLPLAFARQVVGKKMFIGLSTHNPEQVRMATQEGADYLGFGPIFATGTKANLDPVVGIEGMSRIRPLTSLPIFAIGGITPDSVAALRSAGADGVAVASEIFNAPDRQMVFSRFMASLK